MTSVIETVQKLGRHEDFLLTHILGRLTPRTIVLGFETITISPGIKHHTLLRVELREYRLQFIIKSTFVTVAPEDDAGMIDVSRHHLFYDLRTHNRLMSPMPAWLFTFHIETQRVAGIQKLRISRVVAQTNSIHIHALNQQHILDILLLRQRTTTLRTEGVTINALEDDLLPIDKHAVLLVAIIGMTILYRTETKLLTLDVERTILCVFQRKDCRIEIRLFSIPKFRILRSEFHFCLIAGNDIGRTRGYLFPIVINDIDAYFRPIDSTIQEDISRKEAIRLGINSHTLYV